MNRKIISFHFRETAFKEEKESHKTVLFWAQNSQRYSTHHTFHFTSKIGPIQLYWAAIAVLQLDCLSEATLILEYGIKDLGISFHTDNIRWGLQLVYSKWLWLSAVINIERLLASKPVANIVNGV